MKGSSLRTKTSVSVGLIIFVVLGTSTVVHIYNLRQDYLDALNLRFEALAQSIVGNILKRDAMMSIGLSQRDPHMIHTILQVSAAEDTKNIHALNKEKGLLFIAVVDSEGIIAAHNVTEKWDTPVESRKLQEYLQRREQLTFRDEATYHTLIPVFGTDEAYLGTIDIGSPKSVVDEKVRRLIWSSILLLVIFLLLAFFPVSLFVHFFITKPIGRLVTLGQQLAEGNPVKIPQLFKGDEIATLRIAFSRISAYFQNIAAVASHIATGVLSDEVHERSTRDVLGKAVHEMLDYLQDVAAVAAKIAEGDLTGTVQVRSSDDAFGLVIRTMTEGLRTLITQIRTSAEQIANTGAAIASLAVHDIEIVEHVHHSAKEMIAMMREMGASVEETAQNVDVLSISVEMTTASVSQMASAIANIASNTSDLTEKTHQTIAYLHETVGSLETVVKSTDSSKELSLDTIHNARAGQEAVEQVMTSMEKIQQTVTTAVDSMTRFEQRSREIDTILEVIRNITEQTSLLALNASIIAAQAGAHGRGFAVVADEIRSLANGVGASTKDIAAIVQSLQQDTTSVVRTIHEGAEDVKQGMTRTQQARATLQKIITSAQQSSAVVTDIADTLHSVMKSGRTASDAMAQVNTMTADITAATSKQKASTRQINAAIAKINDMSSQIQRATSEQLIGVRRLLETTNNVTGLIKQNLESSQTITQTTKELASQSDILLHSVDRFKLGAKTSGA